MEALDHNYWNAEAETEESKEIRDKALRDWERIANKLPGWK